MKIILTFLFALFASLNFSQIQNNPNSWVIGLNRFEIDTCECKSFTQTNYFYTLGFRRVLNKSKQEYKNEVLTQSFNNGGFYTNHKINYIYDSDSNLIGISSKNNYDSIIYNDSGFNITETKYYNTNYSIDRKLIYVLNEGEIVSQERIYEDSSYNSISFYEYDSNKNLTEIYVERKSNPKTLTQILKYNSSNKVILHTEIRRFESDTTPSFTEYFYDDNKKLIKRVSNENGDWDRTLTIEYDLKGNRIKENYNYPKRRDNSYYLTIYNNKNQKTEVYQLNKRGKRKILVTKYEYEY
jgi:hypothetical protein